MGVIYYKRDLDTPYETGLTDSRKNCSLNGGEIDANFNFLRGYDFVSFEFDTDTKKMKIERVNGEVLETEFNPTSIELVSTSFTESHTDTFIGLDGKEHEPGTYMVLGFYTIGIDTLYTYININDMASQHLTLTEDEYAALSEEEKKNGKFYYTYEEEEEE